MNTARTNGRAPLAAFLLPLLLLCAAHARAQGNAATPPPANRPTPTQQPPTRQTPAQPPAAQQQSAAQPDGAVVGRPERDEQPLGFIAGRVVGEGGEPLPGAVVFGVSRVILGPVGYTRRTATTEEDGSFRLTGMGPGLYNLSVTVPGYVGEVDPQTGRLPGPYRPGDAVTLRMIKGGVVTGKVTDPQGGPMVGVAVRAFRVRDFEGRPGFANFAPEDKTDDRGVYRIYGLNPGVYTVMAGGSASFGGSFPTAFDRDVPTFYPSATRDTAAEVAVRSGQEAAGIDIRHREEQGRRVTGTVEVPATIPATEGTLSVTLSYPAGGPPAGTFFTSLNSEGRAFSIEGVADGEYDAQATVGGRGGLLGASPQQRISVRGVDLTGVKLSVTPLAAISGKLVFEPLSAADRVRPDCKDLPAKTPPQEVTVSARHQRPPGERPAPVQRAFRSSDATPDADGAFTLRNLEAGRYHLAASPSDERFYVSAVQLPAQAVQASQPPQTATTARRADARGAAQSAALAAQGDVVSLGAGQQLTGVTVRVAAGAAIFDGTITAREGSPQPSWGAQSRVYLVPAERERAEDPLRYAEVTPASDGTFSFKNLAPGRYRVLARESGAEPVGPAARPVFWDAAGRAQLRRDAEASGTPVVELQPCQRTTDLGLRLQ